jgi:hypothetical protein
MSKIHGIWWWHEKQHMLINKLCVLRLRHQSDYDVNSYIINDDVVWRLFHYYISYDGFS